MRVRRATVQLLPWFLLLGCVSTSTCTRRERHPTAPSPTPRPTPKPVPVVTGRYLLLERHDDTAASASYLPLLMADDGSLQAETVR